VVCERFFVKENNQKLTLENEKILPMYFALMLAFLDFKTLKSRKNYGNF